MTSHDGPPIRLDLRGYVASSRVTGSESPDIQDEKEAALTRAMVAGAVKAYEEERL